MEAKKNRAVRCAIQPHTNNQKEEATNCALRRAHQAKTFRRELSEQGHKARSFPGEVGKSQTQRGYGFARVRPAQAGNHLGFRPLVTSGWVRGILT